MSLKQVMMIAGAIGLIGGVGYGVYLAYEEKKEKVKPKTEDELFEWKYAICSDTTPAEFRAMIEFKKIPAKDIVAAMDHFFEIASIWKIPEITDATPEGLQGQKIGMSANAAALAIKVDRMWDIEEMLKRGDLPTEQYRDLDVELGELKEEISAILTPKLVVEA